MPAIDYYTDQLMRSQPQPIAAQKMGMAAQADPMAEYLAESRNAREALKKKSSGRKDETGLLDGLSDKQQFLIEMGMQMMASGGRPGATLLGSAGEGAMSAVKGSRQRRDQKRKERREDDDQKLKDLLAGVTLSRGAADAQMGADKFGYQQTQDSILNSQRDRAFGLDEDRFQQAQYQFENPNGQIIQDGSGGYIIATPRPGGVAMPLTDANGQPISAPNPATKALEEMKRRAIADAAGQGRPASKLQEISRTLDSAFGMQQPPAQGGATKEAIDPTQLFIQNAVSNGYTPQEAEALLRKMQQKGK